MRSRCASHSGSPNPKRRYRAAALPLRNVSLSQYVCNFSRFVFWQIHDRITQVLGWALGLSVPDHPVALGTLSDKEAGKVWFVGHFVIERLAGSSSQSRNWIELIIRFGRCGLSVPALTFRPSANFALANTFASCSV
jgi:hypothetical protein